MTCLKPSRPTQKGGLNRVVTKLLSNVAVFGTGVRCAATGFVEREIGDVLDQVFTAK